jgi:hypothetical protein
MRLIFCWRRMKRLKVREILIETDIGIQVSLFYIVY